MVSRRRVGDALDDWTAHQSSRFSGQRAAGRQSGCQVLCRAQAFLSPPTPVSGADALEVDEWDRRGRGRGKARSTFQADSCANCDWSACGPAASHWRHPLSSKLGLRAGCTVGNVEMSRESAMLFGHRQTHRRSSKSRSHLEGAFCGGWSLEKLDPLMGDFAKRRNWSGRLGRQRRIRR